ncbi:MAG TPA: PhzF family phenazine biosynthesis protein [Caulobacteraceae bacterium]|jgi:trans-2,3-dihydro-3-hydroxyanthranilate isomerase|nr:PhzF family phenazine biosynthesis protein [Caulobacteraceae bacterium]
MPAYAFVTLDVFTDRKFGGNPLAVFTDARGLSGEQMQQLAAEFNLSETTFVLPPEDPAHDARVRIFNRTAEMPFAGHPSVGTGFVLAARGHGKDGGLTLEVPAGLVDVRITNNGAGAPTGGVIAAPRPLVLGRTLPIEAVAACAGLAPADVVTSAHEPIEASVGINFFFAEVSADALTRATPDLAAFRNAADAHGLNGDRLALHLYARDGQSIRARMFAPLSGTIEDPATGSANATLAALLVSLGDQPSQSFTISQGVEMRRPSVLQATARREPDGVRATVGGGCVMMFRGEIEL